MLPEGAGNICLPLQDEIQTYNLGYKFELAELKFSNPTKTFMLSCL